MVHTKAPRARFVSLEFNHRTNTGALQLGCTWELRENSDFALCGGDVAGVSLQELCGDGAVVLGAAVYALGRPEEREVHRQSRGGDRELPVCPSVAPILRGDGREVRTGHGMPELALG